MRSSSTVRAALVVAVTTIGGLCSLAPRTVKAGTVVESTMAFINKRPVLLSEVRLTQALLELNDADALERTIDETLMFEEASRLLNTPPLDKDVEPAMAVLREKAGARFSDTALRRKARAQLTIASYIEMRLRPLVRVEDAEVRRLFDERASSDAKAPEFDEVETGIREALERRSLDRRIEEWVTSLRQRAEIRRPARK